ncbi:MAG: sensor domain-containing protein [Coriobacteriia bacterium]|nr:sensor domain-containing protein [Coriobacteriia bacterium]MBN2821685.1 sensor domain-containing protein [Coriobacteriia bacterium]
MIDQYLEQLKASLAGADPALIQDAMYDAEEYLRAEMEGVGAEEAESRFAGVVESYGTPGEVADAYRETEITVNRALKVPEPAEKRGPLARFFGILVDPIAYGSLFYLFLSFATGIAYFTFTATMLGTGIGMLIVWVGIFILLAFFAMVRAIGLAEGRMVEGLLGVRMPRRPRALLRQADFGQRLRHWFTDRRTWTSVLYMLLQLPLGTFYFSLLVTLISVSGTAIAYPFLQAAADYPLIQWGQYGYMIQPWAQPLVSIAGVLGLLLTLHIAKALGKLHGAYAKAMLVGTYSDSPDVVVAA